MNPIYSTRHRESENRLEACLKELDFKIEALRAEAKRDIAEVKQVMAETKAEHVRWVLGVGILQFVFNCGAAVEIGP